MANITSTGGPVNGTAEADIIIVRDLGGGASPDSVSAGDGNDVIFGDHAPVFVDENNDNNSISTATNIDDSLFWSRLPNLDVGISTLIPYTSVLATGQNDFDYYAVTIGAGQRITLDIDYGDGPMGGPSFHSTMRLFEPTGTNSVAFGGITDPLIGGFGSTSDKDAYLTYTATTGGVYFIQVFNNNPDPIPQDATYMLNVSVSGHANTYVSTADGNVIDGEGGNDVIYGGAGSDFLTGGTGRDIVFGEAGSDFFEFRSSDELAVGEESIDGGSETDTLIVTGGENSSFYDFRGSTIKSIESVWLVAGGPVVQIALEASQLLVAGDLSYGISPTAAIVGDGADSLIAAVFVEMTNSTYLDLSGLVLQDWSDDNQFTVQGDSDSETIIGSAGRDFILGGGGNDQITGGTGADQMMGGSGNDVYAVDNAGDIIEELGFFGDDTVYTSVTYNVPLNVEVLVLSGSGDINSTGTAARDIIIGNIGNNTINGAGGFDVMQGGAGNDTYAVDDSNDAVIEAAGGGEDAVYSSVDYILDRAQEIETGILTGNAVILRGDDSNNQLFGNDQVNVLEGKGGTDYLLGLGGDDIFQVSLEANASDLDVFGDFEGAGIAGGDRIALDASIWGADGIVYQVSQTSFIVATAQNTNQQQFIIANLTDPTTTLIAGDDYYFG